MDSVRRVGFQRRSFFVFLKQSNGVSAPRGFPKAFVADGTEAAVPALDARAAEPPIALYLRNGPKVHSSNKAFSNWFDSFRMKENGNRKKKREAEDQVRTAPPSRTPVSYTHLTLPTSV